jgi:CDP-diacylglycerol--glycerol-3-phosphate 3-phosphatidyltransferase
MSSMSHRLRWLPNAITITRLACLPVLLVMLLVADGPTYLPAAIFFAVLAFSDLVDGALARALNATSNFGRIADPLADRLLMAVGLIGVLAMGRFAWPGPLIILVRDALTIAGFIFLARAGLMMRIDFAGKVSSGLNMGVVAVGMAFAADYINWVFLAAVILSLLTFVNYVRIAVVRLRSPDLS